MSGAARPKPNLWPIAAAALGVFGLSSYFLLFARFEALRDTAALNLALVVLAVVAGVIGLIAAFRKGGALRIIGAGLSLLLAGACAALLAGYVFVVAKQLPEPTRQAMGRTELPELTLLDHEGREVALGSLRGTRVLLVFYRGYW